MKQLMEYKIISGRTVEIKRTYLSVRSAGDGKQKRGLRKAGNTSLKKIVANKISSARRLAQIINVNFKAKDGWMTLKYDAEHLPQSLADAQKDMERFLRVFRREYKRLHGKLPKMAWTTANWSPKRKAPARLHQHMVVTADAIELVRKLWQGGSVIAVELDNRADHSDLAAYIEDNVRDEPGKQHWHTSRGMERPIYTEPVPVDDIEDIRPEKGAVIKEHTTTCDEDGRVTSSYLRCVLPEAPHVRGGQIYLTRKPKSRRAAAGAS